VKKKFSDKDVLNLLSNLKNAENHYPSEMIESRRDAYMKQAATMAVLLKAAGNGTNGSGGASASSAVGGSPSSLAMFLETALMVTIFLEAGVAAYVYRDKVAGFITSLISPATEVVSNLPEDTSTPAGILITGQGNLTETPASSPTVTVTTTETPSPMPDGLTPADQGGTNGGNLQVESTPPPKDNPGNHYGNTPKPERTKETGGNSSDNNTNNGNNKDKNK
jgi:hypothetical protein